MKKASVGISPRGVIQPCSDTSPRAPFGCFHRRFSIDVYDTCFCRVRRAEGHTVKGRDPSLYGRLSTFRFRNVISFDCSVGENQLARVRRRYRAVRSNILLSTRTLRIRLVRRRCLDLPNVFTTSVALLRTLYTSYTLYSAIRVINFVIYVYTKFTPER